MENNSSKETILTMALAEHLFSKLATGYCYNIDERATGKEAKTFGRDKPINFEATGIGKRNKCLTCRVYKYIFVEDGQQQSLGYNFFMLHMLHVQKIYFVLGCYIILCP